jgi:transposase
VAGGTVEIFTGHERRRRWRIEDKLRIVAETQEPGARIREVAARNRVYPSLLFSWRRQVREGVLSAPPPATFVPVSLIAADAAEQGADGASAMAERASRAASVGSEAAPVEITLPNGCRLRVDQRVDARALRRIVGALRG